MLAARGRQDAVKTRRGGRLEGLPGWAGRSRDRRGRYKGRPPTRSTGPAAIRLPGAGARSAGAAGRAGRRAVGRRHARDLGQGAVGAGEQAPSSVRICRRRWCARAHQCLRLLPAGAAGRLLGRRRGRLGRRTGGRACPCRWGARAAAPRRPRPRRGCATFLPGETGRLGRGPASRADDPSRSDVRPPRRACLALAEAGDAAALGRAWRSTSRPSTRRATACLMEAHAVAGNRAEGLRGHERCRTLLADELGAYPSPETERCYLRLLEAPDPAPSSVTPAPDAGGDPAPLAQPVPEEAGRPRASARRRLVVGVVIAAWSGLSRVGLPRRRGTKAGPPTRPWASSRQTPSLPWTHPRPDPAACRSVHTPWRSRLPPGHCGRQHGRQQCDPHRRAYGARPAIHPARWRAHGAHYYGRRGLGRATRLAGSRGPTREYDRALTVQQLAAGSTASRAVSWPILAAFGPSGWRIRTGTSFGSWTTRRPADGIGRGGQRPDGDRHRFRLRVGDERRDGTVTRIDPTTLLARTIPVGHGPAAVGVNSTGVWVANAGDRHGGADRPVRPTPSPSRRGSGKGRLRSWRPRSAVWVVDGRDGTW